MKITRNSHYLSSFPVAKALDPSSNSDLRPTRRKNRNPSLTRLRKHGAPGQRRSRPETPLLKWKVEEYREKNRNVEAEEEDDAADAGRKTRRKERKGRSVVSARKLAAGLWQLQLPENVAGGAGENVDRLGFQVRKRVKIETFLCSCSIRICCVLYFQMGV